MQRQIYTLPRAILRRNEAITGSQWSTSEDERNLKREDIVMRQQAQSDPTKLTRIEPYRCYGQLDDHHLKRAKHVKIDEGCNSKTSSPSAAVKTACSELDDDSSVLK